MDIIGFQLRARQCYLVIGQFICPPFTIRYVLLTCRTTDPVIHVPACAQNNLWYIHILGNCCIGVCAYDDLETCVGDRFGYQKIVETSI